MTGLHFFLLLITTTLSISVFVFYLVKLRTQNKILSSDLADIRANFELKVKQRTANLEIMRDRISEYAVKRFELAKGLQAQNDELTKQIIELKKQVDENLKAYEELTRADLLKMKTMRMVIHDLKNPLNIILHNANNKADPVNSLAKIGHVALEMTSLVLNTLDIEKFEGSGPNVSLDNYDLAELISLTCQKFSEICIQKSIMLTTDLPDECFVSSNRNLTLRIFENLLGNACKFTPPFGKINLAVANLGNMVRIEICDNGSGIRRKLVDKVFEENTSDDSFAYAYTNSDGIGLAFCKYAVEAQEGKIGIISKEGEGTRVWFTLKQGNSSGFSGKPALLHYSKEKECFIDADKSIMENIVNQLQGIEISEISSIIKILRNDNLKSNERLKRWKESVESAAFSADKELYDRLLRMK